MLQLVESHAQSQIVEGGLPILRHPDRLQVQWVTYSDNELEVLFASIPRTARPFELEAIFKDVKRNRIGVVIDLRSELIETPQPAEKAFLPRYIQQQLSHPAIVVYDGRAQINRVAVIGGDSWSGTKGQQDCTIGFKVKVNATGRYAVVTAGHCATLADPPIEIDDRIYSKTSLIGFMGDHQVGSDSPFGVGIDAGLILTRSGSTARDDVNYFGAIRDIVGETSDYTIGRIRCWTGQKTGTACSPITCQNLEFQDGSTGKWNNRVFSLDAAPFPGDSGAPAFEAVGSGKVNILVTGIMFARSTPFASCMNGIDGLGSRWQDIRDFYGLTLVVR